MSRRKPQNKSSTQSFDAGRFQSQPKFITASTNPTLVDQTYRGAVLTIDPVVLGSTNTVELLPELLSAFKMALRYATSDSDITDTMILNYVANMSRLITLTQSAASIVKLMDANTDVMGNLWVSQIFSSNNGISYDRVVTKGNTALSALPFPEACSNLLKNMIGICDTSLGSSGVIRGVLQGTNTALGINPIDYNSRVNNALRDLSSDDNRRIGQAFDKVFPRVSPCLGNTERVHTTSLVLNAPFAAGNVTGNELLYMPNDVVLTLDSKLDASIAAFAGSSLYPDAHIVRPTTAGLSSTHTNIDILAPDGTSWSHLSGISTPTNARDMIGCTVDPKSQGTPVMHYGASVYKGELLPALERLLAQDIYQRIR